MQFRREVDPLRSGYRKKPHLEESVRTLSGEAAQPRAAGPTRSMVKLLILLLLLASAPGLRAADSKQKPESASTAASDHTGYMAVLANGFSLPHDHHQVLGNMTRLFLSAGDDNFVDVPTADIVELQTIATNPAISTTGAHDTTNLEAAISAAGRKHGVDTDLIRSIVTAESGDDAFAVSSKGALGLMQLMPATASSLGIKNVFDPEENIDGGTQYIRELLEQYDGDVAKALAAYNAGPGRVAEYRGIPPYHETRAYVARVIRDFNSKKLSKTASRSSAKSRGRISRTQKPTQTNVSSSPSAKSQKPVPRPAGLPGQS